jgi:hypothetical protein
MFICPKYCSIAIVFLVGMIYMTFAVDKCAIATRFVESLNEAQAERYQCIISERRNIYLSGYLLGMALSAIVIVGMMNSINKYQMICITGSITFLTVYFYYILSPKQDLMVVYLDNRMQRMEWQKIYKKMQFNYHVGLLLGVIAAVLLTMSVDPSSSSSSSSSSKSSFSSDREEILSEF